MFYSICVLVSNSKRCASHPSLLKTRHITSLSPKQKNPMFWCRTMKRLGCNAHNFKSFHIINPDPSKTVAQALHFCLWLFRSTNGSVSFKFQLRQSILNSNLIQPSSKANQEIIYSLQSRQVIYSIQLQKLRQVTFHESSIFESPLTKKIKKLSPQEPSYINVD